MTAHRWQAPVILRDVAGVVTSIAFCDWCPFGRVTIGRAHVFLSTLGATPLEPTLCAPLEFHAKLAVLNESTDALLGLKIDGGRSHRILRRLGRVEKLTRELGILQARVVPVKTRVAGAHEPTHLRAGAVLVSEATAAMLTAAAKRILVELEGENRGRYLGNDAGEGLELARYWSRTLERTHEVTTNGEEDSNDKSGP